MNLCHGLVVSPGRLFDLEISEFALYAAFFFFAVKLRQSPEKISYMFKELLSEGSYKYQSLGGSNIFLKITDHLVKSDFKFGGVISSAVISFGFFFISLLLKMTLNIDFIWTIYHIYDMCCTYLCDSASKTKTPFKTTRPGYQKSNHQHL